MDRTACEDPLFTDDLGAYGPYDSEVEFNSGIMKALRNSSDTPWTDKVCDMIDAVLKGHRMVFTHGDLAPRNIWWIEPKLLQSLIGSHPASIQNIGNMSKNYGESHGTKAGSWIMQLTRSCLRIRLSSRSYCIPEISHGDVALVQPKAVGR